jgi:hypothetical protein
VGKFNEKAKGMPSTSSSQENLVLIMVQTLTQTPGCQKTGVNEN